MRSFKKCCIGNEVEGSEDNAIFEKDSDDHELNIGDIHPAVPMKENDPKALLENSDNVFVMLNDDWWLFYCKKMEY